MFNNKKLQFNTILNLILLLVLLITVTIFYSKHVIKDLFLAKGKEHLLLIRDLKQQELERFLLALKNQMNFLSKEQTVKHAFKDFKLAFENITITENIHDLTPEITQHYNGLIKDHQENFSHLRKNSNIEQSDFLKILYGLNQHGINLQTKYITKTNNDPLVLDYVNIHDNYHAYFEKIIKDYKYNDLLMVDLDGNIIYSVKKNIDFASSITSNNLINNELSSLFKQVRYSLSEDHIPLISNFTEYLADYQEPLFFIASKIPNLGVLILSIKISTIEELLSLPENYAKTAVYLLDQDLKLISKNNFGKISSTAAAKSSLSMHTGSIEALGKDKVLYISCFTPIKNSNLNLFVEISKNNLLNFLSTPLEIIYYFGIVIVCMVLFLVYYLSLNNTAYPEGAFNKISDFVKIINESKNLINRIKINNKKHSNVSVSFLNNTLCWFQNWLNQIKFKLKDFVIKHNTILDSITIFYQNFNKEGLCLNNIKDISNRLEDNIYKLKQDPQQVASIISEYKAILSKLQILNDSLTAENNISYLKKEVTDTMHALKSLKILHNQFPFKISRFRRIKNRKLLTLSRHINQIDNVLKNKLTYVKQKIEQHSNEHSVIHNLINEFVEKLKLIDFNMDYLLETKKSLILLSDEQLNNINQLQKELFDVESKCNNFNQQLLEIITNNRKLDVENSIETIEELSV